VNSRSLQTAGVDPAPTINCREAARYNNIGVRHEVQFRIQPFAGHEAQDGWTVLGTVRREYFTRTTRNLSPRQRPNPSRVIGAGERVGEQWGRPPARYFIKEMAVKRITFVTLALVFMVSACATQRYGRLQRVTPTEAQYLTCEAIEIEIEKGNAFVKATNDKDAEFTDKDILAFLGDFGIGNSMEHTDAIESGTDRLDDLAKLKQQKGCTVVSER